MLRIATIKRAIGNRIRLIWIFENKLPETMQLKGGEQIELLIRKRAQSRIDDIRARCDAYKSALDTYDDLKIIAARDNAEQELWSDLLYLLDRIDNLTRMRRKAPAFRHGDIRRAHIYKHTIN